MLEIIALIILSRKNGKLAVQKGLKSGTWILYSVLCWIAFEVIGVIIGIISFGQENIFPNLYTGAVSCSIQLFLYPLYIK